MADVAEQAGVSVSTVSRTLRGLPVSAATRARVERAAEELSFAVSRSASSLASGKTGRIAVLMPSTDGWFQGAALSGVSAELRDRGLDLLVYSVTNMRERSTFFARLPARRNADALLVVSFALDASEQLRLDELGMPVVLVSQHAEGRASVYADDVAGARRGTRHLVNLGHRRIGFVRWSDDTGFLWSAQDRLEGYRQALREAGLPWDDTLVARADGARRRAVREAVGDLLSLPEPPTALVAEDDTLAIEILGVLRAGGVGVPGRMSLLGFDDRDLAEALNLSTVAQPAVEIGRTAARLALSVLDGGAAGPAPHIVLPTHVVPRGSTAPPAGHLSEERAGHDQSGLMY